VTEAPDIESNGGEIEPRTVAWTSRSPVVALCAEIARTPRPFCGLAYGPGDSPASSFGGSIPAAPTSSTSTAPRGIWPSSSTAVNTSARWRKTTTGAERHSFVAKGIAVLRFPTDLIFREPLAVLEAIQRALEGVPPKE